MFKEFLSYQRISIKEGLDIESEKPNQNLESADFVVKYSLTKLFLKTMITIAINVLK